MKILLISSTDSQTTLQAVKGLAAASLSRGHDLSVFFNERSVRLLREGLGERGLESRFPKGTRLLACRTSATTYGLKSPGDLVPGVEMSSLGELVELMEDSDRVLFVG